MEFKEVLIKRFTKRPGTTDKGRDFEDNFVASIALDLVLNEDVKDFAIASNDKNFGLFDDQVVDIEKLNGVKYHYAFQTKHVINDRRSIINSLGAREGNFSIKKYTENIQELGLGEYTMVLLTNIKFDNQHGKRIKIDGKNFDVKILKGQVEPLLKNCCQNCCVYDLETDEAIYNNVLKHFRLYTNQLNADEMQKKTKTIFQETFNCGEAVFLHYLQFIKDWSQQEGKKDKLDKSWMKEVIALCLLSSYVQPSFVLNYGSRSHRQLLLKKTIKLFQVSAFKEEHHEALMKIYRVKKVIEKAKQFRKIGRKYQILSDIRSLQDLTVEDTSKILWLMNDQGPLMVKYHENLTEALKLLEYKEIVVFYNKFDENVSKYSRNLDDLLKIDKNLYEEILNAFYCSIQGKPSIKLRELVAKNNEIAKEITMNQLVQMLDKPLRIGEEQENLPNICIERFMTGHIISDNYLENFGENTAVLLHCLKDPNVYRPNFKMVHINTVTSQAILHQKDITKTLYFTEDVCDVENFEIFCANIQKTCHQFKVTEGGNLRWVRSKGGMDKLTAYQTELEFEEEQEIFREDNLNEVNIILGKPGMGKSTLVKKLKNNTFPSYWTLLIYPKDHHRYFQEKGDNIGEFKEFVISEARRKYNDFDFCIFNLLLKENRVLFIWDGLDEVSLEILYIVLNIIKQLSSCDVKQWLTSRESLKNTLEIEFHVLARTITEFDRAQQKFYIDQTLELSRNELDKIFAKIRSNIESIKFEELLGIPQLIYMFTQLLRRDKEKYANLMDTISPELLYRYFIDEEFAAFFKEKTHFKVTNEAVQEVMQCFKAKKIKFYEKAAARTYFGDRLNPSPKVDYQHVLKAGKDVVGIITAVSSEGVLTFLHNSIGEYFAALYLSKKCKEIKNLSDFIFKEEYKNIRFFFDLLLASERPAQKAVLFKNLPMLKSCNEHQLTTKDESGRTALHLACSWGETYPPITDITLETYWDSNKIHIPKEHSDYVGILEYLLKRLHPKTADDLLNFDSYQYADSTSCLLPLELLLRKDSTSINSLNVFKDCKSVVCYSLLCDFHTLMDVARKKSNISKKERKFFLHWSSYYGSSECCEKLIKQGFNVNGSDYRGYTPLHRACGAGHVQVAQLLLDNGAKMDAKTKHGSTPLHLAATNGRSVTVELLIDKGAVIDVEDNNGKTSLYWACDGGRAQIVKMLLDRQADINSQATDGRTLLHRACERGYVKVAQLLLDNGAKIDTKTKYGKTPLHLASFFGQSEVVQLLIDRGAAVDIKDDDGWTLLHWACFNGHPQTVKMLLDKQAKTDVPGKDNRTPLLLACCRRDLEIVEMLIKHGADVNIGHSHGKPLFHLACQVSSPEIVQALIKSGADVNKCCEKGSPLQFARMEGRNDIAKVLIENGAIFLDVENSEETTPLDLK